MELPRVIANQSRRLVLAALLASGAASAAPAADTVLTGGRIYTPTGWAEAVAISNGRIVRVGSTARVLELASGQTARVELKGRTVLPGLFDMHIHPIMAGNGAEGECRISPDDNADALLKALDACVRSKPDGSWITGAQWQAGSLAGAPITAATLDKVSPDHPVMLFDVSGHSLWVNSRALAAAGIDRTTKDPEAGIIERDGNGEPTGLLRESARNLVFRFIPQPTAAQNLAALRSSSKLLLSMGVVGFTDAMAFEPDLETYRTLAERGELHQSVRACMAYTHAGAKVPGFEGMVGRQKNYMVGKLQADCVKIFTDGVPTESHTSAMVEPYVPARPGDPVDSGHLLIPPDELAQAVTRFDKMGLVVLFHAAGDGAVRAAFDAIQSARSANGPKGPAHQVGHSTFIAPTDMPRARALGATIEFSPYLWQPTAINKDIEKAVGPDRIARAWPIREALDAGSLVVAGSDWAVVPSPDPWLAIETSVTRKAPGTDGPSFAPAQAITVREAVDMFTSAGARQMGLAARMGTIEEGKQATIIILDRNPLEIAPTEIHKVQVLETWVDGRRVFDRASIPNAR